MPMADKEDDTKKGSKLSRRGLIGFAAGAAASIPLVAKAQQPAPVPAQAGGRAGAGGRGGGGRGAPQGGTGPIKVLFISKNHPFDRENLALAFDAMGMQITWTHVEHPAAEAFYDPKVVAPFDVLMFYDAYTGRVQKPGATPEDRPITEYLPPSPQTVA